MSSFKLLMVAVAMSLITSASSDHASDRAECSDRVIGLSTCLTYMQGSARAPTPDCCSGLKQVVEKSFKCLCVLVEDRNEPEIASFKVNVTLALGLPSKCGTPANASDCPRLLNLPLNSPDAKVFQQYGDATKGMNSASGAGNLWETNCNRVYELKGKRMVDGDGHWAVEFIFASSCASVGVSKLEKYLLIKCSIPCSVQPWNYSSGFDAS